MLKRIRRELVVWPDDACDVAVDESTLKLRAAHPTCTVVLQIPVHYPFHPPQHVSARFGCHALAVPTWALAILAFPPARALFPTPDVQCVCCHSVTCVTNWGVNRKLWDAVHEAVFYHLYVRLEGATPPVLPDDVWRYMVSTLTP